MHVTARRARPLTPATDRSVVVAPSGVDELSPGGPGTDWPPVVPDDAAITVVASTFGWWIAGTSEPSVPFHERLAEPVGVIDFAGGYSAWRNGKDSSLVTFQSWNASSPERIVRKLGSTWDSACVGFTLAMAGSRGRTLRLGFGVLADIYGVTDTSNDAVMEATYNRVCAAIRAVNVLAGSRKAGLQLVKGKSLSAGAAYFSVRCLAEQLGWTFVVRSPPIPPRAVPPWVVALGGKDFRDQLGGLPPM